MPGGMGAKSASEAKELAEEEVYDAVVGFAAGSEAKTPDARRQPRESEP